MHLCVALLALLAAAQSPAQTAEPQQDTSASAPRHEAAAAWAVLDVPVGACVDLDAGVVLGAPPGADTAFFRGPSEAFQGNVELFRLEREHVVGPRRVISRAAVAGGPGTPYMKGLAEGDELLWVRGAAWGYVRLLTQGPRHARLEVARPAAAEAGELVREPSHVRTEATPAGFTLRFEVEGTEALGPWRIERRIVAPGEAFAEVGVAEGATFEDVTAPRDRLVEWRVSRAGSPWPFGTTARGLRVVQPGEWPAALRPGMRIDLLSGALDTETAHVEVTQVTPPTLVLKPLGATWLQPLARPGAWALPERATFDPNFEGKLRAFAVGSELAALVPEGVVVRLELVRDTDGGIALRRYAALDGERLAPRPPELTGLEVRADALALRAASLPAESERPELVVLVVERELAPGREDWLVCDEGPPGARELVVPIELLVPIELPVPIELRGGAPGTGPDAAPPMLRVRVRQRYLDGPGSFPTEPRAVLLCDLADEAVREALLDRAITDLDAAEWDRRELARRTLEALGEAAWPRLEVLLREGSVEAQASARLVLAGGDGAGRRVLLAAEAKALGIAGPMPEGLDGREPARRAFAVVRALERAERRRDLAAVTEALGWATLLARYDDDAGVRGYADMLVALAEEGFGGVLGGPGELAALVPPELRTGVAATTFPGGRAMGGLPLDARSLLRELERHPALAVREVGPVLGTLVASLARAAASLDGEYSVPDYDVETADLVLRLVERYVRTRDMRLLEAARGLARSEHGADWQIVLEGWRLATQQRLADERAPALERPRVLVQRTDGGEGGASPTFEDLEGALLELRQSGQRDVDLVLPAGDYAPADGGNGQYIDLDVPGLRLLGEERRGADGVEHRTRLLAGVRVMGARDVVLDGVFVEHAFGAALMVLDGASVVVRGGAVLGLGTGAQVQDADLELFDTHVGDLATDRPGQFSVRHFGRGRLVARGSLLTGGSVYVGDLGEPYLERCVIDAGERPVLQAQRDGRPIVRECLLRATGMGFVNVAGGGCLAGVVLDVPRDPFGPRADGLAVDPRWFVLLGSGQDVPKALVLERSPLEREW